MQDLKPILNTGLKRYTIEIETGKTNTNFINQN